MEWDISFQAIAQKFPGARGWVYLAVPKKYTIKLKAQRNAWGKYPITAHVGNTSWKTKLMTKKGGDFFVALKAIVRKQEGIFVGDKITVSVKLD